ncbi:4Fe-4S dicluster domain-containing protein [Calderihabitans maritimus]|uniref:4Fe-4S ferredoxin n=1 Tax=Calderihabitans maritimus TaxID=1246530 RepID=A0A1Z5HUH3_9FIRM|nr:4Fe-4S dicluster domain-containing protein [Calderihabitans maritimus]GAW92997.1 4Fe-4S ferredoxin [Calderihabitans maritimus]
MKEVTQKMREIAKELLEKNEVEYVVGWEKGTFWYQSPPCFVRRAEEVERLVWDEFCINNLAKYLLDFKHLEGKIALFVKGCDSRGIIRLLQDNQIRRDRVVLVGIPCKGMKDVTEAAKLEEEKPEKLPLAAKCQECRYPNPLVYDYLIGEEVVATAGQEDRFSDVAELEAMSPDERYEYWVGHYDRCIRCFACRNVCPACNCRECCFDLAEPRWLGKRVVRSENQFFAITRAMHVAGRCTECGECERVCPMNIPIMKLNKKIIKDINELFGPYDAGVDLEDKPPLGKYNPDDPDQFM